MRRTHRTPVPLRRHLLFSGMLGLVMVAGCLGAFSFVMTCFDLPRALVSAMSTLALCVGCFTAAFLTGKQRRHGGMKTGLLCGIATCAFVFLFGMILLNSLAKLGGLPKILFGVFCGGCGGICGVNTKMKRPPR